MTDYVDTDSMIDCEDINLVTDYADTDPVTDFIRTKKLVTKSVSKYIP